MDRVDLSMETWEAIRSRRNVRLFTDQPIPGDHLDEILEAGRRAPSSQNWQPWDFVVVTERSRLVELSSVAPGAGHVAGAAAAVAICASSTLPEGRLRTLYFDFGQATMSMMLAAAGLRIGSGHAGVADRELASAVLGLPDDRLCAHIISFGYPADRELSLIRRPARRPLSEVVHRERWLADTAPPPKAHTAPPPKADIRDTYASSDGHPASPSLGTPR